MVRRPAGPRRWLAGRCVRFPGRNCHWNKSRTDDVAGSVRERSVSQESADGIDESLKRLGLDYVDIFYSDRPDPSTPLAETLHALDQIVRQGKALYIGLAIIPLHCCAKR